MNAETFDKLKILGAGAKYDVSCSSSGVQRRTRDGLIGSAESCGLCHAFTSDGRCVSLLKVLLSNRCVYDCRYCISRRSNDVRRTAFEPRELAELTISFYRRNYIEGLFLSSAVDGSASRTMERMIETLRLLRDGYGFTGYIHAKAIPGADPLLVARMGLLADRMSVNIEMPSEESLQLYCPQKSRRSLFEPMRQMSALASQSKQELRMYRHAPQFSPAGQTTQMIIGASPESDLQIMRLSQALYHNYRLKRVYYSAYVPLIEDSKLPAISSKPPLLREHRLYQADWLIRFYGFRAEELLDEACPMLHPHLDPKCSWALRHMEYFPLEVQTAGREELLRVPGMGVRSVQRILAARRQGCLSIADLRKLGVVTKRAQYFITCGGRRASGLAETPDEMVLALMSAQDARRYRSGPLGASGRQLSFFDAAVPLQSEIHTSVLGEF